MDQGITEGPPQQLRMRLYRKDSFKSHQEEKRHAKMLEGFLAFLETLRQTSSCAVMENDMVSVLCATPPQISALLLNLRSRPCLPYSVGNLSSRKLFRVIYLVKFVKENTYFVLFYRATAVPSFSTTIPSERVDSQTAVAIPSSPISTTHKLTRNGPPTI